MQFHKQSSLEDGHRNQCKVCDFKYQVNNRAINKEKIAKKNNKMRYL